MSISDDEVKRRKSSAIFYTNTLTAWLKYYNLWYRLYYVLGLLLIIFSALAGSSKLMGMPDVFSAFCSFVVIVLTGAIGLLRPEDRGSRYRQAWSLLGVQLSRYFDDETYVLNDVIKNYEQGESIIHQVATVPHK